MSEPVVIILAAGRGERFLASGAKTHKLAAMLNGRPVLGHVIQAVKDSGLPWYLFKPETSTQGMGESIALSIRAISQATGWLILPADLPLIQPSSLQRVAEGLEEKAVVVPHYLHHQGHPVGFRREYRQALLTLSDDGGAREIVEQARARGDVKDIHLPDYGLTHDIDTLSDLRAAQQLLTGGD